MPDDHAHEDLQPRVTQQLRQLPLRKWCSLKSSSTISFSSRACSPAARRTVEASNIVTSANAKRQRKQRSAEPDAQADRRGQAADHGRVRAGHSARADQVAEIQPARPVEAAEHLGELRHQPGAEGAQKHVLSKSSPKLCQSWSISIAGPDQRLPTACRPAQ